MISYLRVKKSPPLHGYVQVKGAKNAILVIMASLVLTKGTSCLTNISLGADVLNMIKLLEQLGATIEICEGESKLYINTAGIDSWQADIALMKKFRASTLIMGPLLARFGKAQIGLPGGCKLGARPIDYHLNNFKKMGVIIQEDNDVIIGTTNRLHAARLILEYPSVGATENIMMAAVLTPGVTTIVNAALEPEVLDLITVLQKMGAHIKVMLHNIEITGVTQLYPVEHSILPDRLEAGTFLAATAITGGDIYVPGVSPSLLDLFLFKLEQMGHTIIANYHEHSIRLKATVNPKAVSFKTGPYPQFPTDLQAPMMALQCIAQGNSTIEETVFENRMLHAQELQKLGANIVADANKAYITGIKEFKGAPVIANDIRSSCALVLAGLAAQGITLIEGVAHWRRGYEALEVRLQQLGADIEIVENNPTAILQNAAAQLN